MPLFKWKVTCNYFDSPSMTNKYLVEKLVPSNFFKFITSLIFPSFNSLIFLGVCAPDLSSVVHHLYAPPGVC